MGLSIVIAHRGDTLGLWCTVQSCVMDLQTTDLDYKFVIINNGDKKVREDLKLITSFMEKAGKLGEFKHLPDPISPPAARQLGAQCADGEYLFFLDNHCLVESNYFKRSLADFEHYKMDMLHSAYKFFIGEYTHYHYRLNLAYNFWGEATFIIKNEFKPYRIAASGHGGFAIRKSVWDEVGGYGPEGLFQGYGGEEIYFDLKMALLDKTNWLDPKVIHHHYAGRRGYSRHYTDDFYRNMMMVALIIGGEEWMNRVHTSFQDCPKHQTGKSMYQLMREAYERGKDHAQDLAKIRKRTLDEQLALFVRDEIAYD